MTAPFRFYTEGQLKLKKQAESANMGSLPDWVDDATGLRCQILRSPSIGCLCGYVAVPKTHPYYGKDYNDLDHIAVHGGLTFSGHHTDDEDVWWFGFDTGHYGDLVPGLIGCEDGAVRDVDFVRNECIQLARQLLSTHVDALS